MLIASLIRALISFFTGVIGVLLGFRIIMMLFGASTSAAFTMWVYENTDSLVSPFVGIFPSPTLAGTFQLDTAAIFAVIVYSVAGLMLSELVNFLDKLELKPKKKE